MELKKVAGNIGDYLAACLCMLFLSMLLMAYMESISLLEAKQDVDQIGRRFMLRMETVGCLSNQDRMILMHELENAGVTEIDLSGTSFQNVEYGQEITLQIKGKLGRNYEVNEKLVSTAKN